jgi:hypothetical protein
VGYVSDFVFNFLLDLVDQISDQLGEPRSTRRNESNYMPSSVSLTSLLSSLVSDGTEASKATTREPSPSGRGRAEMESALTPRRKRDMIKDLVQSGVEFIKK